MIDFKKMDDRDFVFINQKPNDKEDAAFSEFLRNRKKKPGKRKRSIKELQSR
jgi:hypothetical protein